MKRVISLFLSIVMMFSVISTVDLSAYADDNQEDLFEVILTKDNIQYFKDYFLSDLDPTKQAFYIDHLTEMNHENDETHMQVVQDSINRVQKTWNQVLDYMPESISNSQIISMGDKTFSYLNGTVEVFKNIEYIATEDERATQICYHGLKAVNTALSLCGISLGPVSIVLKTLEKFFILADILWVTMEDSIVKGHISNYDMDLSIAYLAHQKLKSPDEFAQSNNLQNIIGDKLYGKWYEKASAMYLHACMKVMADNMKNRTVIKPINQKNYYNGHTYQVISIKMRNEDAKIYCKNLGGHLAIIDDNEEHSFVSSIAPDGRGSMSGRYWIDSFYWAPPNPEGKEQTALEDGLLAYHNIYNSNDSLKFICEWDSYIDPCPTMNDEHIYVQTVITPTCTDDGYTINKCDDCGLEYYSNNVIKIGGPGHSYSFTKTVAPTCSEEGYELYTCSVCNGTEKRNTVSSTGHNYEEISNTATCTDTGVKMSVCSKCGDKKNEDTSSLGHSYSKVYIAPTCTKDGGYTNTCSRCGDITYNTYSALGHDYGECTGQDYIDKISGTSISATPNYFNEFYHTSSSIGSTSKTAMTSTNMSVPNEIRIDKNNMTEIVNYQFGIKSGMLSRRNCSGIFAYDKSTGRSPEQSAIPYTDNNGNLVNMKYVDYKVNDEWICGEYNIDNNIIVDKSGNIISDNYSETRPHIVYKREYALKNGIMNSDGTVNVDLDIVETSGVSFSAGIPRVYFTPTHITPPMNSRQFIDVFGYDESANNSIKAGKYDVDICFYNTNCSGLSSTTFKIYDDTLVKKTPATKTSDETITYTCMDCNKIHTDTYKLDIENFKIKTASLSLESSITMNFKVLKSAVADFENPYLEFDCNGEKTTVSNCTEQGDYLVFAYKGISPQMLGDEVTATLYGEHNGIEYKSESKSLSVKGYIDKLLLSCNSASYAKLRTVLVDLLNYGAAAQIYRNYKTDKLVNADLTDEQKSWGTSKVPTLQNITDKQYESIDNPTVQWNTAGLVLNDSVMLRSKFTASDIENLTVKISCNGREFTYTKDDFVSNNNGTYYVYCDELYADEMSENVFITAYNGDKKCSNTLLFSVESYAKAVQDNYPNTALKNLTDAMMCYGKSAEAYRK